MKLVDNRVYATANEVYEAPFIEMMNFLCFVKDKETYIKELEEKNSNTMTT